MAIVHSVKDKLPESSQPVVFNLYGGGRRAGHAGRLSCPGFPDDIVFVVNNVAERRVYFQNEVSCWKEIE